MRTIVVDDEPWMLKRFAIECEGLPDIQLLGSFNNPLTALKFASRNPVELAFLDVEMPKLNGMELAGKLKQINPEIIIIFVSAYDNYIAQAFKTKVADYYIMKPYSSDEIEAVVDRARLLSGRLRKTIFARTFGTFELFTDNNPVVFQSSKDKEFIALLIDRCGSIVSVKEAANLLWTDLPSSEGEINFHQTVKHVNKVLAALHIEGIIGITAAGAFVHKGVMDCDLYQFLDGNPKTIRQYSGEYMVGYEWAEENRIKLNQQSTALGMFQEAQTQNSLLASIRTLDNPERKISYMNDSFFSLVGYTRDEIKERFKNSFRAMVLREDFEHAKAAVKQCFEEGKTAEVQYRIAGNNDNEIWVICKSEPPKTVSGDIREISSILIDISATKAEQNTLEKAAHRDSLTGLLNRGFAEERIRQYLATEKYDPSGALVIIDVDNFKAVNDTYGHPFADTVLTDIAAILIRSFRSDDIVCRLGGDEIMLFLKGINNEDAARKKLKATSAAISDRLSVKTQRGELSCSFGGAMCPQDGCDFETLYGNADRALYRAKENKNCVVWFKDITDVFL